jgi:RNA polymerase primary sigma factor
VATPPRELLTADEEVALGRRVRAGDLSARDELVQRNRYFALRFANSYRRRCRCRCQADLDQAALLGLVEGANAFDPDRHPGKRFATIARYYVRLEILNYLYGRPLIRIPHSARPSELARRPLGDEVNPRWYEHRAWIEISAARAGHVVQGHDDELDHPDPSQCCLGLEDSHAKALEQLRLGLEMLPPWHAEVIRRRFGLGGRPKETAQAIAREAGVSTTAVFAIQRAALGRLRKEMTVSISA